MLAFHPLHYGSFTSCSLCHYTRVSPLAPQLPYAAPLLLFLAHCQRQALPVCLFRLWRPVFGCGGRLLAMVPPPRDARRAAAAKAADSARRAAAAAQQAADVALQAAQEAAAIAGEDTWEKY